jgi:YD repeat-containing protein
VNGPQNGQSIPVLWKVMFADNSGYQFSYTPWGQVQSILRNAADGHRVNTQTHFLTSDYNPPQTDCPRITGTGFWVEDWVAQNWRNETHYSTDGATGAQVATMEDQTSYREYYSSSGWQKGLLVRTENYAANESSPRKWTITDWTQDNTLVNYQANPRPTEMNIFDADGNHRRSTVEYTPSGLPRDSYEFAADGTTVLRRAHTDYVNDREYSNRHILGLPNTQFLYGRNEVTGVEQLLSKIDYQYDANGQYDLVAQGAPVQHDEINYGIGLVYARGNLTSTRRFDVNYPSDESRATVRSIGYNTTGLPYFTRDPMGHQVTIRYEDWFSDNVQHNAMAYPTKATDADGFSSMTQYSFDFGGVTRKEGPPPHGFSQGAIETAEYDLAGRVSKIRNEVNGAYTRFEYPDTGKILNTFTTIRSTSEEAYTAKVFDGAGRVRAVAGDLPNGDLPNSGGRYWGQYFVYDIMGRVSMQSNPTETSATGPNWAATGDDDPNNGGNGWVYTQQAYDWKGRPTITTNQDGTTKEASYGGCGCAGGEVVTLTDEGTIDGGVAKRRQQKIYSDVLGRTVKTEILNWQGGSVYATTIDTYNARDQVTSMQQYQGDERSGIFQETSMTYDGYGRPKTKHIPEQDANTLTTWNYNSDDSLASVTDARGASAVYSYNARHLVTGINYSAPSGITATAPVNYAYDAVGNRTSMTDGLGSVSYSYNQLSRLTSETRAFSDPNNSAINGVAKTLAYDYNLAGELKKITDSGGVSIAYDFDQTGHVLSVTGTDILYAGISTYASNLQYRAWGAVKSLSYGNAMSLSVGYTNRFQIQSWTIGGPQNSGAVSHAGKQTENQYYADGRLKYSHDVMMPPLDRAGTYDQVGSLKEAYSGSEAYDYAHGTNGGYPTGPYRQSYQHDAFGNMTSRENRYWSQTDSYTAVYNSDNRNQAWLYDAAGNMTNDFSLSYIFDASGKNIQVFGIGATMTAALDGDGQLLKRVVSLDPDPPVPSSITTTYYLRSSILGGKIIADLGSSGQKLTGYVYLGEEVIATQSFADQPQYQQVVWRHTDPVTGTVGVSTSTYGYGAAFQPDPVGVDLGFFDPYVSAPEPEPLPDLVSLKGGSGSDRCRLDGMEIECSIVGRLMATGSAAQCPNNDCSPRFNPNRDGRGRGGWELLYLFYAGFSYQPIGASGLP